MKISDNVKVFFIMLVLVSIIGGVYGYFNSGTFNTIISTSLGFSFGYMLAEGIIQGVKYLSNKFKKK